mmetsp:Transcript_2958/g.7735  ORF Transcript_2958/g.7735 Transcript_2958/m.7735 type:complete len:309 (-) Transcript_2958:349-1275(-)
MILDLLVHNRLGKHRLVKFVVPMSPVAKHVDDHILLVPLPILDRQLENPHHRLHIVAIDVENRHAHGLRHIRRIRRRPGLPRIRRKSDLVIHNDMYGSAGGVIREIAELQHLGHHALSRERRVAVEHDRNHAGALGVAEEELLRAGLPDDDGVHGLEVRRVREERKVDVLAATHGALGGGAQVVLDVAGAEVGVRVGVVVRSELVEDLLKRFVHDVRENVEAPPMRHPNNCDLDSKLRPVVHHGLEARDHRLRALQPEPLRRRVLVRQKLLEQLRLRQIRQHLALLLPAERLLVLCLHKRRDPLLLHV